MKNKCKDCIYNSDPNGLYCKLYCTGVDLTDGNGIVLACEDYVCPTCKNIISQRLKGSKETRWEPRYCRDCGQALDWRGLCAGNGGETNGPSPRADVVEVVRCKECKYWCVGLDRLSTWCPVLSDKETIEDDFCSFGERKKVADEGN